MNDYTVKVGDDLPPRIGAIVSSEGKIDLSDSIRASRKAIRDKYPVEASLADLLEASPAPKLRSIDDILKVISGDTLSLDQVFDLSAELQAWQVLQAANQKARDDALAALDADIKAIVADTESKLQDRAKQALVGKT